MNIAIAPQETKTFSVKEIFDAIEHNGFKHLREEWVSFNAKNKAVGACVLGQAALNLNVITNGDSEQATDAYYEDEDGDTQEVKTLLEQLDQFETPAKWRVTSWPETNNAGSAIVYWNDKHATKNDGEAKLTRAGHYIYELKKYEDVVQMAREVLEPHFEKTVELTHYEY